MRIAFALLLPSFLAGCGSSPSPATAEAEILRAVLAHEAASDAMNSYGKICVRRSLEGVGLDQSREQLDGMEQIARELPELRQEYAALLRDRRVSGWNAASSEADYQASPLPPEEDARLASATRILLKRDPEPSGPPTLPREWISAPLGEWDVLKQLLGLCSGTLTPSRPAIAGPFAFMDAAFDCGTMCGWGQVIALEKRESGWTVIAQRVTWVS